MAVLKDFHKEILPDVQGCPLSILNNALINTLIDFCRSSQVWKSESPYSSVEAEEPRYRFSPNDGERVVSIDYATYKDRELAKTSAHTMDSNISEWRVQTGTTPTSYYIDAPDMIRLIPTPSEDADEVLKLFVTLCPTRAATEVPDWLYEDWASTIAHGTLAKLHAMSNKTWANPGISGWHERKYRNGVSMARSKNLKSYLTISKEIQPRSFFGV